MATYEKTRYAAGDKLELLSRGAKPPHRSLSAVNAWTITSVATRLGQIGEYSAKEEQAEAAKEAEMVKPSFQYGSLVNPNARPDPSDLEEARRMQIRSFRAIRDVSVYGESSIHSALTSMSAFLARPDPSEEETPMPPTTDAPKVPKEKREKITKDTTVLLDGTGSDWSDVSAATSMATTATLGYSLKSITPIRARINRNLLVKGKPQSIPVPEIAPEHRSSDEDSELPESTVVPDEDSMNMGKVEEILDETLDDIQSSRRRRPKNLLLGKNFNLKFPPYGDANEYFRYLLP